MARKRMDSSVAAPATQRQQQATDGLMDRSKDFESLFEANWEFVFALLYRITGDPEDAEDLALDTFWKLYQRSQHARTEKDIENLRGWLYRTATNAGLNSLRSRKRRDKYESESGGLPEGSIPEDPTAQAFEKSEQAARVRRTLGRMKKREARLLILRYQGLSYTELAAVIGVSKGSIGKMLARAETAFERFWQQEEGS